MNAAQQNTLEIIRAGMRETDILIESSKRHAKSLRDIINREQLRIEGLERTKAYLEAQADSILKP